MGAFLRFTLLVGALVAAAAVGYAVGLSRSARFDVADERMTIDTGGSPAPARAGSGAMAVADRQEVSPPALTDAELQAPNAPAAASAGRAPDAPTSIDDILDRQISRPTE